MTAAEANPDDFKWELYNINKDFSQAHNIADQNPTKLKELQDRVRERSEKVQRLSARFIVHSAVRHVDSSEPHNGEKRVRLLSRHVPHP